MECLKALSLDFYFSLYINDFENCSTLCHFHLFADDSNLFLSNKNIRVLEDNANSALIEVSEWLNTNKLSLNVEKSNHVIFHPPQQKVHSINITVHQKKLEHKEYIKYLGVLIDSKLSWKSHIWEILKKVSRSVGILAKMRHYANINVLTKFFYAIIYPFLIYDLLAWGSTYPATLIRILLLRNFTKESSSDNYFLKA